MGSKPNPDKNRQSSNGLTEQKRIVVNRLEAARLNLDRFINVRNGTKSTFNHTRRQPGELTGNYGVYTGEGLLALDIDDMGTWERSSGPANAPATFTVATPHDGQHRYYRATADVWCALRSALDGTLNPPLDWGELYASKYLVGPGSKLDDCSQFECSECSTNDPGQYTIEADRPIARISSDDVIELLYDGAVGCSRQSSVVEFSDDVPTFQDLKTETPTPERRPRRPSFQQKLGGEKLQNPERRLVWGVIRSQNRALVGNGVEFGTVLDEAEKQGVDIWSTARVVRRLLDAGTLRRGKDPNRIIPHSEEGEQ